VVPFDEVRGDSGTLWIVRDNIFPKVPPPGGFVFDFVQVSGVYLPAVRNITTMENPRHAPVYASIVELVKLLQVFGFGSKVRVRNQRETVVSLPVVNAEAFVYLGGEIEYFSFGGVFRADIVALGF